MYQPTNQPTVAYVHRGGTSLLSVLSTSSHFVGTESTPLSNQLTELIFPAVKFGRMSKKQREKVEDEANMVKASRLKG